MDGGDNSLAFSEPQIYPSRDYVVTQTVERPTEPGRFYGENSTISITIRSPGQNEFFDVDKMRFEFSVLTFVQAPTADLFRGNCNGNFTRARIRQFETEGSYPTISRNAATVGLPMANAADAMCNLPGVPYWGVPFFSSVRAQIPGLPTDSLLNANGESQWDVATRLMCAGGAPMVEGKIGPLSFGIAGPAYAAGARPIHHRARCVNAACIRSDRGTDVVEGVGNVPSINVDYAYYEDLYPQSGAQWIIDSLDRFGIEPLSGILSGTYVQSMKDAREQFGKYPLRSNELALRGSWVHYSLPCGLFTHLCNMPSCQIPFGFYSSSSDSITFTFNCAPASYVVNNLGTERPDLCGAATYYIADPELRISKLNLSNPSYLAAIESLYRGTQSIPIAPGVSVPLSCILKFINYSTAQTSLSTSKGQFSLSIPANQPSVRGIALRFIAQDVRNAAHFQGTVPFDPQVPWTRTSAGVVNGPVNDTYAYKPDSVWAWAVESTQLQGNDNIWGLRGITPVGIHAVPENTSPGAGKWLRYSSGDGQWGGRYLLSARPILRGLIVRIAGFRVPLDPLFDLVFPLDGTPTPGMTFNAFNYAPMITQTWREDSNLQSGNFKLADAVLDVVNGRQAFRMYQQGRHLFSPFATHEDPETGPLAELYMSGPGRPDNAENMLVAGVSINQGTERNPFAGRNAYVPSANVRSHRVMDGRGVYSNRVPAAYGSSRPDKNTNLMVKGQMDPKYFEANYVGTFVNSTVDADVGIGRSKMVLPQIAGPNLCIFPLESFPQIYNHRDDAFALRGLDLRAIATIQVLGEVLGTQSGVLNVSYPGMPGSYPGNYTGQDFAGQGFVRNFTWPNDVPDGPILPGLINQIADITSFTGNDKQGQHGNQVQAGSWIIRGMLAYDQEHVLLPGRVDVEAQFSLIPTGATAIPTGGAPSL